MESRAPGQLLPGAKRLLGGYTVTAATDREVPRPCFLRPQCQHERLIVLRTKAVACSPDVGFQAFLFVDVTITRFTQHRILPACHSGLASNLHSAPALNPERPLFMLGSSLCWTLIQDLNIPLNLPMETMRCYFFPIQSMVPVLPITLLGDVRVRTGLGFTGLQLPRFLAKHCCLQRWK